MTLPARRGQRIKRSILGTFSAVVLFVVAAFFVTVYSIEHQTRDADLAQSVGAVETLLQQKVEKEAKLMGAVAMAMFGNHELEGALAARDRSALIRIVTPLFDSIRSEHGISHFYFTGPDRVNLVRLYDPGHFGDVIDRFTLLRAHELDRTVHGLELGRSGTLTLRTVTPWHRDGETLGYVELGQEIEHLLLDIRATLGVELLAFVEKRFLSRGQWEAGLKLLDRDGQWDDYAAYVLVGQTTDGVSPALKQRFPAILAGATEMEAGDSGRSLFLAGVPLTNAAGEAIGRLVVVRDASRLEATFRRSLLVATLVSTVAGMVVFLFFRSALARVERDYHRQYELELRLLRMSTEHRRMVQVEKLSALGTMIGEIAHQLNNPLVGVVNMAQLAERLADDPVRVRKLLTEIRQAGQDCGSFVQRMLGFTKVSRFRRKTTDMNALIRETVSLFRQSGGRSSAVELLLPEAVSLAVDPVLLRHALFNLLANAGQATDGQGRVQVSLQPAPSPEDGRPGWTLAVDDDGEGLAPEVQGRLFTPFFTTRPEGTGLGLPVVLHVALLHGGRVDAVNRPEGGARFAIWLPEDYEEADFSCPES